MKYLLFLFVFFCCSLCIAQKSLDKVLDIYNTHSIPYISVEELRMLQTQGEVVILDSRERMEYEVSHIKNAEYIGYTEFSALEVSEKIKDKNTVVVVYCSLGVRSEEVGEKLKKVGFTNIKNLYGGILEWKNKEFPVVNQFNKETDSVHTSNKYWSKWLKNGIKVYD